MFWAHTEVLLSEDLFETLFRRQLLIFSSHFSHMFPTHPCSFELGYGQNRTLGGKRHKKSRHHFSQFILQQIGAGLSRTGTSSLKVALEQLLGGPCYHGTVPTSTHPDHLQVEIRNRQQCLFVLFLLRMRCTPHINMEKSDPSVDC